MDSVPIRCSECPGAFFKARKNLYAHIRRFHKDVDISLCNKVQDTSDISVQHKKKREISNVHNYASSSSKTSRLKCPYPECFELLATYKSLRDHLLADHGQEVEKEQYTFTSMDDFLKWKDIMEQKNSSHYSLDTAAKHLSGNIVKQYFNCHRSYCYKPKGHNLRSLKLKGSCKIGKACPSRLEIVARNQDDEIKSVEVTFWKTHYGLPFDLGHTFLRKETRIEVAGKLAQGVTFQHVIDEVRDSDTKSGLQRGHLLEKKDLHNIVRDFNLSYTTKRHCNDAVSVHLWVNEMLQFGDSSPVLKYKGQNEEDSEGILKQEDFFLVLMTEFQGQQLKKFGQEKICIDGTHGTNAYDINLFTLLVVDEYGTGCPTAFCFSNRSDETIFTLFFQSIRQKVGKITSKVFMSDDAPAFYNAWYTTMGDVQYRLLCSWHVDHNWRQNLNKIANVEKRDLVYKTLKVLLHLDTKDKFEKALSKVLLDLSSDAQTEDFGNYFLKYYCNRTEMWAYCFRHYLGINTNMYLESVHKTLKYYYLEGKKTRRLDKTIHAVMKLARDSLFKRIIKMTKSTSSSRIHHISLTHNKSLAITSDMIKELEENEWLVKSSSTCQQEYVLQKVEPICSVENCSLKCIPCNICVHMYKCSCMDSVIKFNICKHIHAASSYCQINYCKEACDNPKHFNREELNVLTTIINKNVSSEPNVDITQRTNLIQGLGKGALLSADEHKQVLKHLNHAITILNKNQVKFCNESKVRTNSKVDKQVRFFSTKKRRIKANNLGRPNSTEEKNIRNYLENGQDNGIVIHTGNDHTYSEKSAYIK